MLQRERFIEIAVAVGGVAVMVAAMYLIGRAYTTGNGSPSLSAAGGELVVVTIVAFVLLFALAGYALLHLVTVPEAEDAA